MPLEYFNSDQNCILTIIYKHKFIVWPKEDCSHCTCTVVPRYMLFYSFQAKRNLIQSIDKFIQEKIVLAGVAISETYARTKINDGDVILTYAWCVELNVLVDSSNRNNWTHGCQ